MDFNEFQQIVGSTFRINKFVNNGNEYIAYGFKIQWVWDLECRYFHSLTPPTFLRFSWGHVPVTHNWCITDRDRNNHFGNTFEETVDKFIMNNIGIRDFKKLNIQPYLDLITIEEIHNI